ncbi:MAG: thymidylate synthase [Rikenellaceae bacterium]|jgi:thymidylate synthase|nr:thymidylate synthase [Rikenellaceae bacterium]
MFTAEYAGINSLLKGTAKLLLDHAVKREIRGHTCWELPSPCMFKIINPQARIVTIPERKWNPILPYAESLWLASGGNDLNLVGRYVKRMKDYSDDGIFLRGGYGPRLRGYNGISSDYKVTDSHSNNRINFSLLQIDQYKYIEDAFKVDFNTRQAIITIGDPPKDDFNNDGSLKATKDYPCTQLLHFQKQADTNKLDLTVYMRSNDVMWGASAVNIFNFTFIQEYFSCILGLEIGNYYHIVNNFHYYENKYNFKDQLTRIYESEMNDEADYLYSKSFKNLDEFDHLIKRLSEEEEKLRCGESTTLVDFEDDFFNDWYKAFTSITQTVT